MAANQASPAGGSEGTRHLLALIASELDCDVRVSTAEHDEADADAVLPLETATGDRVGGLVLTARRPGETVELEPSTARLLTRLVGDQLVAEGSEATGRLHAVRAALRSKRVPLAYQSIVDLTDGSVTGVEALARFPGAAGESPADVFAQANTIGVGEQVEALAIGEAVAALDTLAGDQYLSVNASPGLVLSGGLRRALDGAPLDRIVIEVTEHTRVSDYGFLNEALRPLRRRGARLAVDDVGNGFANMRHVLRLHPDIIKIDATLTHDLPINEVLRTLARSLRSFGAAVGAEVVAEGVESPGQLGALQSIGVPRAQGFYLRRPGPLPAAPEPVVL